MTPLCNISYQKGVLHIAGSCQRSDLLRLSEYAKKSRLMNLLIAGTKYIQSAQRLSIRR